MENTVTISIARFKELEEKESELVKIKSGNGRSFVTSYFIDSYGFMNERERIRILNPEEHDDMILSVINNLADSEASAIMASSDLESEMFRLNQVILDLQNRTLWQRIINKPLK